MIWAVFALPFEAKGFKTGMAGVEVKVLGCCGRRALQVFEGMVRAAGAKPDTVLLLGLAGCRRLLASSWMDFAGVPFCWVQGRPDLCHRLFRLPVSLRLLDVARALSDTNLDN